MMTAVPEYIKKLIPYEAPLIREGQFRLFMNENLFGPAPKCCDVFREFSGMNLCRYTHKGDYQLAEEIAKIDGISAENICLNHGSSEVIKQIFSVILEENDKVLVPTPGWSYYNDVISIAGGEVTYYSLREEDDFAYNIDVLIELIEKEKPKAIVITSPNMPTGNKISQNSLIELVTKFNNCYFIVDEAYWGFDEENTLDVKMIVNEYSNVVITRTFSKFFGLASERIGWLTTSVQLCKLLKKAAPLFGIAYSSQMVAMAALESKEYYKNIRESVKEEIDRFKKAIDALEGFRVYPSASNFVLIKVPKDHNEAIVEYLEKRGILIRDCSKYGIDSFIRISIGTPSIDIKVIDEIIKYANEYC